MPRRPNKHNIVQPKRSTGSSGGSSGLGSLRNFTNAQDIKARFWANAANRRQAGDKASGDATYWTEGRCNWGGSHNLMEDCQTLASWANNIVSTQHDAQELTLAVNEQEFNQKKQALVNKYQDCINKCQLSDTYSIGNVCCIWNDYFGSFVVPITNELKQDLQAKLNQLQAINPTHQKEILEIEAELKAAETKYNDAMAKAAQEVDPAKKAQFIAAAQAAEQTIKQSKTRLSQNPLSRLAQYSYLNQIGRILDGNVPSSLPRQSNINLPSGNSGSGGSGDNQVRNNGGSGKGSNPNWNPFRGSSGNPNNQSQPNQQQIMIIAVVAVALLFFLMNNQTKEEYY